MLKISCYLHKIYQGYVLANPPPPTGQKLIMVFSYRSAYVFMLFTHKNARGGRYTTVLFTQKIPEYLFKKKIPTVKVTMVFLPQLSDVRCVYYHLFTHKLSGIFSHLSSPMVKVTTMFVSKLSGLWRECYRAIYRNYRGAGSTNLFPMIKVTMMLETKSFSVLTY